MLYRENEDLKKHTTIRIGGLAKNYYVPENANELLELILKLSKKEYKLLGAGSNVFINDRHIFENVIQLSKFDESVVENDDGTIRAGGSCSLPVLINNCKKKGFGGIEYLFYVPGTLGGAICMNAGRGKEYNKSISDFIVDVETVCVDQEDADYGKKRHFDNTECGFGYRDSIFKSGKYLILSATLRLDKLSAEKIEERIKERREVVEKTQDRQLPNSGSVFMESDIKIMDFFKKHHIGATNGVHFSTKTRNWIVNDGDGNFRQAKRIIRLVTLAHRLLNKKCQLEVIVWDS